MDETTLKHIFGRSLRRLRIEKDKTQSQLAEETGISEEYLSKIERGLASPSFLVIARLTDVLGVRPPELFRIRDSAAEPGQAVREHLSEAEELLRGTFESLPLGLFVSTHEGRFLLVSPSFTAMLGYGTPQELLAAVRDIGQDLYAEPSERDEFLSCIPRDGSLRSARLAFKRPGGERRVVTLHMRRLPGHEPAVYVGIVEDESTSRLVFPSAGTHDKPALAMREFHHRVLNAFSLLHSYLEMELLKAEESPCRQILGETKARVHAMARLHRRLMSPGTGRMRVRDYLREVLDAARCSLPPDKSLNLAMDIEDVELDWHQALSAGMIALELVTNAVKHGFPQGGAASVRVSLSREESRHRLEVADNGVGLPPDIDPRNPKSFGLTLVSSLVNQLQGDLCLENDRGARFSVVFPVC